MLIPILRFSDPPGTRNKYAAVLLLSGEVCVILIGRHGVHVRKSLIGRFGPNLYREQNGAKITVVALALHDRFPNPRLPFSILDFNLSAITNAVMHCRSCAEVKTLFLQITRRPAKDWPKPPWSSPHWITPTN
jgi:hypothetical protein